MANFPLIKQVFNKTAFDNTVDTSFSELTNTTSTPTGSILPSVTEFFNYYQALFYQIPKFGEINSHEYLIKTSQAYIGENQADNDTIQALIDEITQLRQENIDLQQLLNTSTQGSIA